MKKNRAISRIKSTAMMRVGHQLVREGYFRIATPGLQKVCEIVARKMGVPDPGKDKNRQWALICAFDSKLARQMSDLETVTSVPDPPKPKKKITYAEFQEFYRSRPWRELRHAALKLYGAKCQCCGGTPLSTGGPMHVDHIKPRSKFPELELEISNLQILCEDCNMGKGGQDQTDWRGR